MSELGRSDVVADHVCGEHRRQTVRQLDELDGRRRGGARPLGLHRRAALPFCYKIEDAVSVKRFGKPHGHRSRCFQTERPRTLLCDDEIRRHGPAKRREFSQPLVIEPLDR